tara:strand:- start:115 stop:933 length:819 start_codon:yes stop_codon:yes gene_type:complete
MGNRRLGKRRLKAVQGASNSSSDEWGLVRPTMVPGLARNLRVVAIGQMHGFGFEDMTDVPADGQTTAIWLREDENSAAIALTAADADFTDGAVTLTPGSGADDAVGFMTANQPFTCTTDKPWWIETSFKIADINDCEIFFGVTEDAYDTGVNYGTVAAGAGADKIGFKKATHSTGVFTTTASLNAAEKTGTGLTVTADNDVVTFGIHWDGKGNCEFYGAFAATGTEVGDLPLLSTLTVTPDQGMGLVLQQVHTTGAANDALIVNYVRGAWTI